MIESRKISVICAVFMAAVLLITALMFVFPRSAEAENEPLYAEKLFGSDIIEINVIADEKSWQDMLDNAINEEYISADIIINGVKFSNAGIRPKGNNSLQQVVSSDSDRYSFKIKFDEYIEGQTCFGLDMLVLNNMYGDATYMKEYISFDMMHDAGVETPYYSYADISVNGEKWGLYFALEAYGSSYEQRISGDESGILYNVKADMGNGGMNENGRDNLWKNGNEAAAPQTEKNFKTQTRQQKGRMGGMGGAGASGSGGSLVYTDDNSSSYSAIFENAVGSDSSEEDHQRVITALRALNSGENIEQYFNVDEILRYLAVHTVTVNLDSYCSNMAQNYYIYEYNGMISILPWDYNYAWGGFQTFSASDAVNFPIDTPVSGVQMSERPLISKLFENNEYLERYHSYLKELMDSYFSDGKFAARVDEINSLIGEYVRNDPSAFYSYEEYQTALSSFKTLGELRMQSIYGQLDKTIPSSSEEQEGSPEKLINSSSVNLSDLGGSGGKGMRESSDGQDMGFALPFDNSSSDRQSADIPQMPDESDFPDYRPNDTESISAPDRNVNTDNFHPVKSNNNFTEKKSGDKASELYSTAICAAVLFAAIIGVFFVKRKF